MPEAPEAADRGPDRAENASAGRVVLYRSASIKWLRLLIGLLFVVATLILSLPIVSSQKRPPPPTGLFVGLNTKDSLPPIEGESPISDPASNLYVAIRASGCHNPATVEGYLSRPEMSWALDKRFGVARHGIKGPTHAEVVLAGANVESVDAGLAGGEDIQGAFEASEVHGIGSVLRVGGNVPEYESVHNQFFRYLDRAKARQHPIGAAVLIAPQWPNVRVPLHFTFTADMVHPFGYHRCYVDVPALFVSGGGIDNKSLHEAEEFTMKPGTAGEESTHGTAQIPGFADVDEVARAEVSVLVAGHVADGTSLGSGATTIPNGAHYECSAPSGSFTEQTKATCAGDPVFEIQGTDYDITRRLFAAGITGAVAAAIIIEGLFATTRRRKELLAEH